MQRYNPKEIEPKWQKRWQDDQTFRVSDDASRSKKYIIDMFPYPSGAAMHVGHVRNFTISDVLSQFHRQKGFNVMHTMGWDTFGLPAENYAIKTGTPPAETTRANIANFKHQLQQLGMSYDWSRELNTSDPSYYKWTQWIFTKLFENGLAYKQESPQWWCPFDKTVLANEQVEGGRCWRCGNQVVKKNLNQWFFKITAYADALLAGIDDLDWPEKIKAMQRNWIGRSEGAELTFRIEGSDQSLKAFSTRPDTIFGATFVVVAPEHPVLDIIVSDKHKPQLEHYREKVRAVSDIERQETNREKTGVFSGCYAVNPASGEKIPIWVSDYVLYGYGTGAIMAVPAHDERDHDFAEKFKLPVTSVVVPEIGRYFVAEHAISEEAARRLGDYGEMVIERESPNLGTVWRIGVPLAKEADFRAFLEAELFDDKSRGWYSESMGTTDWVIFHGQSLHVGGAADYQRYLHIGLQQGARRKDLNAPEPAAWHGEGILINSGSYSGLSSSEAREKIVDDLAATGSAEHKVNYKIHDWLISRQRYWGAPIPIIHCPNDGPVAVPEKDLPVVLPEVKSFLPTDEGSVLAGVPEWVNTTCPKCGGPAKRETDTMDGYACSSWYFLRYTDPHNDARAWDPVKANYWLPIDFYCGGDHAVSHLLYSRFWMHFFADQGWIEKTRREPVGRLVYNGYILAYDGQKMSKSKGNVVNPDDLIEQGYGADSVRLFEMFIAPYDQNTNWNTNGVPGTFRFLQRIWVLAQKFLATERPTEAGHNAAVMRAAHQTIKAVTQDLEALSFNTAVASMMEYVNTLYKLQSDAFVAYDDWRFALESLFQLLAPFAPHVTEELWEQFGHKTSVHLASWPHYEEAYLVADTMTVVVQINGKVRAELSVATNASEADIVATAMAHERVKPYLDGTSVKKTIYVPGKLVSFVV